MVKHSHDQFLLDAMHLLICHYEDTAKSLDKSNLENYSERDDSLARSLWKLADDTIHMKTTLANLAVESELMDGRPEIPITYHQDTVSR